MANFPRRNPGNSDEPERRHTDPAPVEKLQPVDRDNLSAQLQYPVPSAFVRRLNEIIVAINNLGSFDDFTDAVGFYVGDEPRRYKNTPPELFPFGWMGVGGVHYGHVLYTPELSQDDYPVAHFSPTDFGSPASAVGTNSVEAISNLLAAHYEIARDNIENEDAERSLRLFAALQFDPRGYGNDRIYGPDGNGRPITPAIAPGYRHVLTSDGIGVMAPVATFAPEDETIVTAPRIDSKRTLDDRLTPVRRMMDCFPASALLRLKEEWWNDRGPSVQMLLEEAYRRLGRDIVASAVSVAMKCTP